MTSNVDLLNNVSHSLKAIIAVNLIIVKEAVGNLIRFINFMDSLKFNLLCVVTPVALQIPYSCISTNYSKQCLANLLYPKTKKNTCVNRNY